MWAQDGRESIPVNGEPLSQLHEWPWTVQFQIVQTTNLREMSTNTQETTSDLLGMADEFDRQGLTCMRVG